MAKLDIEMQVMVKKARAELDDKHQMNLVQQWRQLAVTHFQLAEKHAADAQETVIPELKRDRENLAYRMRRQSAAYSKAAELLQQREE